MSIYRVFSQCVQNTSHSFFDVTRLNITVVLIGGISLRGSCDSNLVPFTFDLVQKFIRVYSLVIGANS